MRRVLLVTALMFCISCFANSTAIDIYQFDQPAKQQQFYRLLDKLRCLVCQNEDLRDSNAQLAQDLRKQVYDKVQQGESDKTIIKYLVARYGNFVLFKPPVISQTYLLWFGPFILLLLAFMTFLIVTRKNRQQKQMKDLTEQQQQQLQKILTQQQGNHCD